MCSERDFGSATRERPVDRPGICYCSVPESIQVVLRRIQILSFDDFTKVAIWRGQCHLGRCLLLVTMQWRRRGVLRQSLRH